MQILQVSWPEYSPVLQSIRRRVFIEEQGVDQKEEWDGLDEPESTLHFVVLQDESAIATARLLANGKLGRMAVLREDRGKGIGRELLNHIIGCAIDNRMETLFLHAQSHALPFYEKSGFEAYDAEFFEAGIAHRKMKLELDGGRIFETVYGDRVLRLENLDQFNRHLKQVSQAANRTLDILSHHLDKPLYAHDGFVEAVSGVARYSANSMVRILLRDSAPLNGANHPLVSIAQRLPSRVIIRTLTEQPQNADSAYVISDRQRLVYFNDESELVGFACYKAAAESLHQLDEFDKLWERHSQSDPNLARLHI